MSEILCPECGHPVYLHYDNGCVAHLDQTTGAFTNNCEHFDYCECSQTNMDFIIEARTWARRMKQERDEIKDHL